MKSYWLFRIEKKGRGWVVLDYIESYKMPMITNSNHLKPMKEHTTISKVKKNFEGTPMFTCVVEYDITAPSTIYQLIIEFSTQNEAFEHLTKLKLIEKDYICNIEGKYHINVPWIDTAPTELIKEMNSY